MEAREKIITTAVRLFSAQGYGNTSLSQVAKEAEVSKALIFWHFDNKETLFRTAVQRTLEPYFINVLDDLAGLSEIDQMKRLIDQYYDFVSKNVYSVKFFLSLILRDEKHPDDLAGHMGELQRVFLNLLVDILESGRENGLFRDDISPALDARARHERPARHPRAGLSRRRRFPRTGDAAARAAQDAIGGRAAARTA